MVNLPPHPVFEGEPMLLGDRVFVNNTNPDGTDEDPAERLPMIVGEIRYVNGKVWLGAIREWEFGVNEVYANEVIYTVHSPTGRSIVARRPH